MQRCGAECAVVRLARAKWVWPPQGLSREPNWPHGGLYLDGDGNGVFNKDAHYGFWVAFAQPDVGQPRKAFYTPSVTREARDRKVFGVRWPTHIATIDEVEQRASREDALRHIPEAVRRLPRLAILVFESQVGHVTAAADHPHAIAQVNLGWMPARAGSDSIPTCITSKRQWAKRRRATCNTRQGKASIETSSPTCSSRRRPTEVLRTRREWPLRHPNWPIVPTAIIGRQC